MYFCAQKRFHNPPKSGSGRIKNSNEVTLEIGLSVAKTWLAPSYNFQFLSSPA
jgi:hypothetical protein